MKYKEVPIYVPQEAGEYNAIIRVNRYGSVSVEWVSNPKEPEAVHGNEAEKEVCESSEWYEDAKGQRRCPECNGLRKYHS